MSTELRVNDKPQTPLPKVEGLRVGIVVAEWNAHVTEALLAGALEVFKNEGYPVENILVEHVPGTVELTYGASRMMRMPVDAVIVFGCVIRGGTPHFDYVCDSVTQGVAQLNALGTKPVVFGVPPTTKSRLWSVPVVLLAIKARKRLRWLLRWWIFHVA